MTLGANGNEKTLDLFPERQGTLPSQCAPKQPHCPSVHSGGSPKHLCSWNFDIPGGCLLHLYTIASLADTASLLPMSPGWLPLLEPNAQCGPWPGAAI